MSFFSALFGGSNPTLSKTMAQTGSIGNFATGMGESNSTAGSNFFHSLLSGNQSKISSALAPETSLMQSNAQQAENNASQFGTRSGGTAATMANIGNEQRGNMLNLVGRLQTGAASNLLGSGQEMLGMGLNAYNQQANMSEEQMQNWQNSLFGGALTGGAAIGMKSLGALAGS